jgi:hydrogenase-4 component F
MFLVKNKLFGTIVQYLFVLAQLSLNAFAFINKGEFNSFYFKFDGVGILFSFVLTILTITTLIHSKLYLSRHITTPRRDRVYYSSLMMLVMAMTAVYFADHLAVMWISIEATTLFVAILIYHERTEAALEASWKYLFISSIGVALAFVGILFLSAVANSNGVNGLEFKQLIETAPLMDPVWLKITFLLVLTGFSAKMGIVPLHTVTVDAHTAAPSPISAFISTTLMNVGFLGIFRVYTIIVPSACHEWANKVLIIAGVLSIAMSAIQLLKIKHFKRMFAFSSLEHMGIVILALSLGKLGAYAALMHIVFHSFVKAGLFYQIGQVHSVFHSYWIKDTGAYMKINPIGSLAMILGFLSITAMPPSGLFVSEFLVLKALFLKDYIFLAVVILILLTVIIYVFGKHIFHLIYAEKPENFQMESVRLVKGETISQFVLFALVIYLGVNPPAFFTELLQSAILLIN